MRVLVDARRTLGGVERYTCALVSGLQRRLGTDRLEVYGRPPGDGAWRGPQPRPPRSRLRAAVGDLKRVVVDQWHLPHAAARAGVHVVHSPNYLVPARLKVPAVVNCFDLWLLDHPETKAAGWVRRYERATLLSGLRRAGRVVTPTETVAGALVRRLGLPPDRVSVVPPPPPELPAPAWPADDPLPPLFFLSVGTLEPRKNLDGLLVAHRRAWPHCHVPLWLVGPYGWRQEAIVRQVDEARGRVRWLGPIPDDALAALYRSAAAVVQLSHDEGFSYPVAEALAHGAPLLVSDLPAHRELAGDCARYVPVHDVEEAAGSLVHLARAPARDRRSETAARRRLDALARRADLGRLVALYEDVAATRDGGSR